MAAASAGARRLAHAGDGAVHEERAHVEVAGQHRREVGGHAAAVRVGDEHDDAAERRQARADGARRVAVRAAGRGVGGPVAHVHGARVAPRGARVGEGVQRARHVREEDERPRRVRRARDRAASACVVAGGRLAEGADARAQRDGRGGAHGESLAQQAQRLRELE